MSEAHEKRPSPVAGSPESAETTPARKPFPTWRIVVWSIGNMGNTIVGGLTGLMTYFYLPPETEQAAFPQLISTKTILGLTLIGLISYLGGLVAVALGPFVAGWSDRSKSRLGRRRIFMLVSILPIGLLSYLMFVPPIDHVSPLNAVWLLAIIVFLNIFRSLYGVSNALVPEFGTSSRIIALFNTFGPLFWLFGYIIGTQMVFMVKDMLMATGMSALAAFRLTVGGMVAIGTILGCLQVWVVDERRYGSGKTSTVALWPALKMAFKNRTFVLYTLIGQVYGWSDGLFQGGLVYTVTLIFGLSDSMMLAFGATMAGLSLLVFPVASSVALKTGKKPLYLAAMAMLFFIMLVFAFGDKIPVPGLTMAWIMVIVAAIPVGITTVVPSAISQEIIREDCLRTGEAKEATFNAAAGLITSIPSGFVGLIMPSLLLLGKSRDNPTGARAIYIVSAACLVAAFLMLRFLYDEKKLHASLKEHGHV